MGLESVPNQYQLLEISTISQIMHYVPAVTSAIPVPSFVNTKTEPPQACLDEAIVEEVGGSGLVLSCTTNSGEGSAHC